MSSTSLPKVIGTGLKGLIGSKLSAEYADQYDFANLDIANDTPVDITQYDQVLTAFNATSAEWVIHFAAFTNVSAAWEQTNDKNGPAYQVNVLGTQNIVKACEQTHKKLIHISTAYVFDGNQTAPYLETDPLQPIEWYGQTKAWAEEAVSAANAPWCILRIDQPFRSDSFGAKPDVVRKIIAGLQNKSLPPQFDDHFFGPTFIDDFVKVIDWVIRTKATGLYHASSGEQWSDFDFANLINRTLNLGGHVTAGSLTNYLATSQRPYQRNTALNCQKLLSQLDFTMHSIPEAISQIKL